MSTRLEPDLNSLMMTSRSFWSMSPCYKTQACIQIFIWVIARCGTKALSSYSYVASIIEFGITRADTVKSRACIFSVSQSTFLRVFKKMTAWVMVRVSYKSHSVSSFHSCANNARRLVRRLKIIQVPSKLVFFLVSILLHRISRMRTLDIKKEVPPPLISDVMLFLSLLLK